MRQNSETAEEGLVKPIGMPLLRGNDKGGRELELPLLSDCDMHLMCNMTISSEAVLPNLTSRSR